LQDHPVDKHHLLQDLPMNPPSISSISSLAPQPHPATFFPALSDERLSIVAVALLDMRHLVIRETNLPHDDSYTRGTRVFGCSRNRLIEMANGGEYDWMALVHAGMDVTFTIGGVPCRYFQDDPDKPEKSGFFKRNVTDNLFPVEERDPVMWRFIVEPALLPDAEDRVFFIGYNVFQEKVSEWMYQASTPNLHSLDQGGAAVADMPPAEVDLPDEHATGGNARAGNDG
jgi:hypothetical protein